MTVHGEPVLEVASTRCNVALVRRHCVEACCRLGWAEEADTVELLVSELTTHAVLHQHASRVRVQVLDCGLRLRVEVSDDTPVRPAAGCPRDDDEGPGLLVVDALAVACGRRCTSRGTTSWFEVGL